MSYCRGIGSQCVSSTDQVQPRDAYGISAAKQTALGPVVLSHRKSPSPKQLYHGLLPFHSCIGSRDWADWCPIAELGQETRVGADSVVEWWFRVKLQNIRFRSSGWQAFHRHIV